MLKYLLYTSLIYLSLGYRSTPGQSRPVFGVNVCLRPDLKISSYNAFLKNEHSLHRRSHYDLVSFGKILTGQWPSIYNPHKIDLLKKHKIDYIFEYDPYLRKERFICPAFDSLWKIRFQRYPIRGTNDQEAGWSTSNVSPSRKQLLYLKNRYDINKIDGDFFLDTNFFKILQDVTDNTWIFSYKALR